MRLRNASLAALGFALVMSAVPLTARADEVDEILGGGESKPTAAKKPAPAADKKAAGSASADDDVIVVERKSFLLDKRLEVGPAIALTLNDPFVQHTGLGVMVDFHLTEALSVGLRGLFFFDNNTEVIRETVRLQSVPLLNRYDWAAALTMHYVPFYGKFSLFRRTVLHFDAYVGGGIGAISTTVLVAPTFIVSGATKIGPTVNVALGARLYLTKFLALYLEVRDWFLLIDPEDRGGEPHPPFFAGNMLFTFGATIFLPASFKYTTAR
ncbi:MAG TPA: outer membrane beta-barrel domain-containing protein [Myxococcota bacterium]|jgi:outer membrane beta-barrel protein|nr:outer membrane beta-barrel domain-containing protein [Myxococcota bacterium]